MRALHRNGQQFPIRFSDVISGARLDHLDGFGDGDCAGEDDDRRLRRAFQGQLEGFIAVELGQTEIEHDNVPGHAERVPELIP